MKPLCVVSCPIDTFSGYGARSRDFVKSLIEVKDKEGDIKIIPQMGGETPWNFLSLDDPLRQRFIPGLQQQPDIWIQITIPSEFQSVGRFNTRRNTYIKLSYCLEFTWYCNLYPNMWLLL